MTCNNSGICNEQMAEGCVRIGSTLLAGAVVHLRLGTDEIQTSTTDSNGRYHFSSLLALTSYNIRVWHNGVMRSMSYTTNYTGCYIDGIIPCPCILADIVF